VRTGMTRPIAVMVVALSALSGCGGSKGTALPASTLSAPSTAASTAGSSGSTTAGQRLVVQYGVQATVPNAPVLVPTETGGYAAQRLDISPLIFTDTVQIMVSVGQGQLQMGTITMGAAAFNALNRGVDLRIVASSVQDPQGHGSVVPVIARADLYDSGALRTALQLKGRKFAINAKGTVLEYALAKLMARADLRPSDLDLVLMPATEVIPAFANKSIDAAVLIDPWATAAITQGVGKVLSDDHIPGAQVAMVAANTKFAEQHPDAVERFLAVYLDAIRTFDDGGLKRDKQALAVMEKYTKVPPDITRQAPDAYWPRDGRINVESLKDQQNYYLQNKSVDYSQPIDLSKVIDYSYLDAALARIGR
jgi:NitT/TauT family transport system substrate-binding protein